MPPSEAPTIQPPPGGERFAPHASTIPGSVHSTVPGAGASALTTGHPTTADLWFQPGSVVGDAFRVERELGRGAMGVVVLANHLALDRLVALKVHPAKSPEDASRLAREAKAMAKVRHPNVVGIYDVREAGGTLFIAMEYIEGQNARRWLAQGDISWRQRLDVCVQAAHGLQAAHEAGLVHRDFKPENILIGADGRVLVADFGLARAPGAVPMDPATPSPGIDAQLTAVGQVTGTPAYMSPEQWSGGPVDARSDVFALSVVIYEALYGRRPFEGKTPSDLIHTISRGMILQPPPNTEVPKAVFDVLRRGMAVDPRLRFGAVAMLLRALDSATSTAGRAGIALAVALAVAVFGTLGGAAWALRTRTEGVRLVETSPTAVKSSPEPSPSPPSPSPSPSLRSRPVAAARPTSATIVAPAPRGPTDAEIDAAQARVDDLTEKLLHGLTTPEALVEATGAMHDLLRRSRDRAYTPTSWDGKSTFVCGMGDRVELRDVKAKLDTTAIKMDLGCGLKLVDVDIEAPVAISGQAADRLVIEGGTFDVSRKGIELQMAEVDIRNLTIEGDPLVAVSLGMHAVGKIENSRFGGLTALRVGTHGNIEVRGGRMSGKTAVEAEMGGAVLLDGTEVDGATKRGRKGRVETASGR